MRRKLTCGASLWALALTAACALEPDPTPRPGASGSGGQTSGGSAGSAGGSDRGGSSFGGGGNAGAGGSDPASGGSSGAGNSGAGGAAAGSGGAPGSGGSGGRVYSTDPATFFGEPRCNGFAICESFESTALGQLPDGFELEGYGDRTVGVSDQLPARGTRSLGIEMPSQVAVTAWLTRASLGALGTAHYGRAFVQITEPAPEDFIHFDLFAGKGPYEGHTNEVRMAATGTGFGNSSGNLSFIYNVQPSGPGAGSEFASEGDRSAHPRAGAWMCVEWWFDAGAQEARFYLDGSEIEYLHIDTERAEIPVFDTLAVGFGKYQNAGPLLVYVDEAAFDPERIGCNN